MVLIFYVVKKYSNAQCIVGVMFAIRPRLLRPSLPSGSLQNVFFLNHSRKLFIIIKLVNHIRDMLFHFSVSPISLQVVFALFHYIMLLYLQLASLSSVAGLFFQIQSILFIVNMI